VGRECRSDLLADILCGQLSLWLDAMILIHRAIRVLAREGTSPEGHETLPRSLGAQETSEDMRLRT
jgi:hypothetical protein